MFLFNIKNLTYKCDIYAMKIKKGEEGDTKYMLTVR